MAAILVGGLIEVTVAGLTFLLAIPTAMIAAKVIQKALAITKKQQKDEKCDYCGSTKLIQGNFWDQLPEKSGKFRANKYACYYKDMEKPGTHLQFFKRTGHDCPHMGQVCSKCGAQRGKAKGHKHPKDCPYK